MLSFLHWLQPKGCSTGIYLLVPGGLPAEETPGPNRRHDRCNTWWTQHAPSLLIFLFKHSGASPPEVVSYLHELFFFLQGQWIHVWDIMTIFDKTHLINIWVLIFFRNSKFTLTLHSKKLSWHDTNSHWRLNGNCQCSCPASWRWTVRFPTWPA